MTAMKIIRDLLPSALHQDAPSSKRRKTQSLHCNENGSGDDGKRQYLQSSINGNLSSSPSLLISRTLADHGMPDRRDPFSMDYLMDFDYNDGSRHYDMPAEILMAIQYGNVDHLTHHYKSRNRLIAQRNSQGETLLHLACRWGSFAVIKSLLCDLKISAFVLDKHGRSPLHNLCLGMNISTMNGTSNTHNCNHFESMRLLLQDNATLILYKDKYGKVPLEYIEEVNGATDNYVLLCRVVNQVLNSERIANRLVEQMLHQVEISRSGQRMTIWEKLNNMIDVSGVGSAIMETGLSI